ncbi:hypothetical protein F0562_014432 [Nyssa sinensis]|uniref:BAG domain-containing protein n=1 Tax=Nyssa sinensis TaxID=561372 RepID=A0A5J4ZR26_9ASTE|nr:hypothetical protein F0562_014432 [Nyssa sinensis]
MKSSRKARFFSSSTTTIAYTFQNDHSTPQTHTKTTEIPIDSASEDPTIPITVHLPTSQSQTSAAVKIQAAYRSYKVRTLVNIILAVNSETNRLERLIQRQETVDAVRTDNRERIKMNEALMGLLLRLDSVPGFDQTVRELRRHVSRRIVGLQEILDAVSDARVEDWDGFLRNWDDGIAEIEEDVCRERGGHEMERFCAENLGFRCLQRVIKEAYQMNTLIYYRVIKQAYQKTIHLCRAAALTNQMNSSMPRSCTYKPDELIYAVQLHLQRDMHFLQSESLGYPSLQSHFLIHLDRDVPPHKHRDMQRRISTHGGQPYFIRSRMQFLH